MEVKSEEENISEVMIDKNQQYKTVKRNKKSIISNKRIVIALFFVFIVFGIGFLFIQINSSVSDTVDDISLINEPTVEINKNEDAPDINAIYIGTYKGQEVIFSTTENAIKADDPYTGIVRYATGSAEIDNFKDINNPVKILSFDEPPEFSLFVLNEKKDKIYLDIIEGAEGGKNFPYSNSNLYVVDLNNLDSKIIWSFEINSGKYENVKGAANIRQVIDDKYAVFDVLGCYGCEPVLAGKMIVNLETRVERFKKNIGNVELNLENNTYTYQNLQVVVEECPEYLIGSPYCNDDNTMEVKRPRGEFILETLP